MRNPGIVPTEDVSSHYLPVGHWRHSQILGVEGLEPVQHRSEEPGQRVVALLASAHLALPQTSQEAGLVVGLASSAVAEGQQV